MRSETSEPSDDQVRRVLESLGQTERPTSAERTRINNAMLLALDPPPAEEAETLPAESNLIDFSTLTSRAARPIPWVRAAAVAVVVGIALVLFTQLERTSPTLATVEPADGDLALVVGEDQFVINDGAGLYVVERRPRSVVLSGSDPQLTDPLAGVFLVGRVDDLFGGQSAEEFFAANDIETTPRIVRGGDRLGRGWLLTLATRPTTPTCASGTWCVPLGTVDGDTIAVEWGSSLSLDVYDDPDGGSPIVVAADDLFRVRAAGPLLVLEFSGE